MDEQSKWWEGPSQQPAPDASPTWQDEMAVIASAENGFGYRADDHSNGYKGAEYLGTISLAPIESYGIIEQTTDSDWFVFDAAKTANVEINVQVAEFSANLNAKVDLYRLDTFEFGGRTYQSPVLITSADPSSRSRTALSLQRIGSSARR